MKLHRVIEAHGRESAPPVHFGYILAKLEETLNGIAATALPTDRLESVDLYASLYLKESLLKKRSCDIPGLPKIDKPALEQVTLDAFLDHERRNRRINQCRTWGYDSSTGSHSSDLLGVNLLIEAQSIIRDIIGDKPNMDLIMRRASFGSGASATLSRRQAQSSEKYVAGLSVTTGLRAYMTKVISTSHVWSDSVCGDPINYVASTGTPSINPNVLKPVLGGVYDTVVKDIGINRVIIKEPELNGYLQKGIGAELRRLLRTHKIPGAAPCDLNTSGSVNSELAREGSISGAIATVDGRRASDSITVAGVEFLLPAEWVKLIMHARSPYCVIPNHGIHALQMVSGMGNGFTFELESIIFYAIGLACARRSAFPFAELYVSIHGDDLVIPSDVISECIAAYTALGVEVNKDKTFASGPFRESCGGHWFDGFSVKPFYVKTANGSRRGDWFWLYNSLLLWLNDRSPKFVKTDCGKRLHMILRYLRFYASSGQPHVWSCPASQGRRTGLYSDTRTGKKSKAIVTKFQTLKVQDKGKYCEWLDNPVVSPSVYDVIFKRDETVSSYESLVDGVEVEGFKRFVVWDSFSSCGYGAPLWPCERTPSS